MAAWFYGQFNDVVEPHILYTTISDDNMVITRHDIYFD